MNKGRYLNPMITRTDKRQVSIIKNKQSMQSHLRLQIPPQEGPCHTCAFRSLQVDLPSSACTMPHVHSSTILQLFLFSIFEWPLLQDPVLSHILSTSRLGRESISSTHSSFTSGSLQSPHCSHQLDLFCFQYSLLLYCSCINVPHSSSIS